MARSVVGVTPTFSGVKGGISLRMIAGSISSGLHWFVSKITTVDEHICSKKVNLTRDVNYMGPLGKIT